MSDALPVTAVFEVHAGRVTVRRDCFDVPAIMNVGPQSEAARS